MTTVTATGYPPNTAYAPTLSVAGGAGNTGRTEVHLLFRDQGPEETRTVVGWFDADDLLDALHDAIAISRQSGVKAQPHRLTEPAADAA